MNQTRQQLGRSGDVWRSRQIQEEYVYAFLETISLQSPVTTDVRVGDLLLAVGINREGFQRILGIAEGGGEPGRSWSKFVSALKDRGLTGVKLFVGDQNPKLIESLGTIFPGVAYQGSTSHFYHAVCSLVPDAKVMPVAKLVKAIHRAKNHHEARTRAAQVVLKLHDSRLHAAATHVETMVEDTLRFYEFPPEHRGILRENNSLERVIRDIRRRCWSEAEHPTRHCDFNSMAARLRHLANTRWKRVRRLDMGPLSSCPETLLPARACYGDAAPPGELRLGEKVATATRPEIARDGHR